jgi:hypothetical protein
MVLSCLGNRRGEEPVVASGTATLMAAMSKAAVPRMALVSSIGVGDSSVQLLRLGVGGWIFSAIFATLLRSTQADLNAAEALAIGAPAGALWGSASHHARPDGVSVTVVRPAGLSDAPGEGKYDAATALTVPALLPLRACALLSTIPVPMRALSPMHANGARVSSLIWQV